MTDSTFKNINVTIDTKYAELIAGWIRINVEGEEDEQEVADLLSIAEQMETKVKSVNGQ